MAPLPISAAAVHRRRYIIDGGNSHYRIPAARSDDAQRKIQYVDPGHQRRDLGFGPPKDYSLMIGADESGWWNGCARYSKPFAGQGPGLWAGSGCGARVTHQDGPERQRVWRDGKPCRGFLDPGAQKERVQDRSDQIAEIWRYGSVVRSWMLDLTPMHWKKNHPLKGHRSLGRRFRRGQLDVATRSNWVCPAPSHYDVAARSVCAHATNDSFSDKIMAAMRRNQSDGHEIKKE